MGNIILLSNNCYHRKYCFWQELRDNFLHSNAESSPILLYDCRYVLCMYLIKFLLRWYDWVYCNILIIWFKNPEIIFRCTHVFHHIHLFMDRIGIFLMIIMHPYKCNIYYLNWLIFILYKRLLNIRRIYKWFLFTLSITILFI